MFTSAEIQSIGKDEAMEAINEALNDLLLIDGEIELASMTRQKLDIAIHMIRQYRAMMPELPAQPLDSGLEIF